MKKMKISGIMGLLILLSSCSLTVDLDDQDEVGSISATVLGDNSDGSVSLGGYLDLEISAFDRDGIASIRVEIPALNIDYLTNSNASLYDQKISQTFVVNEIDSNESAIVYLTLTDKEGYRYTRTIAFTIK